MRRDRKRSDTLTSALFWLDVCLRGYLRPNTYLRYYYYYYYYYYSKDQSGKWTAWKAKKTPDPPGQRFFLFSGSSLPRLILWIWSSPNPFQIIIIIIIIIRISALKCSSNMLGPQLRLCRMAWVRGEGRESNKATNICDIANPYPCLCLSPYKIDPLQPTACSSVITNFGHREPILLHNGVRYNYHESTVLFHKYMRRTHLHVHMHDCTIRGRTNV